MNEIVNKFLFACDKYIYGPFTKNKKRIEKFMQTGNTDFIYKNNPDKACFQHDMAYGKSKNLAKRTKSDKVLRDKAFDIANDRKYDQALSGDFQRACGKMHVQILFGVRWCAMYIFFFLKFYNFVKEIMCIHSIFKKPKTNVFTLYLLTF